MFKPVVCGLLALMLVGGASMVVGAEYDPANGSGTKKELPRVAGEKRDELIDGWLMMSSTLRAVGRDLGAPLAEEVFDLNAYDSDKMAVNLNSLIRQCKMVVAQRNGYVADLRKIGEVVGAEKTEDIIRAVREYKRELARSQRALTEARGKLSAERARFNAERARAEEELDRCRAQLNAARQEKASVERELARVKADYKNLTAEDHGVTAIWAEGSPEARSHIRGRVVKVDPELGFLVTDISTSSRAVQRVGAREIRIDPKFEKGMELIVCREKRGELQFIARIRINSIDDRCSVANIPPDAGKAIRAGDVVIWISR